MSPSLPSRFSIALVFLALVTACAPVRKTTIYDDLGGRAGVAAIVEDVLNIYADDARVAPFFANTNLPRFRKLFAEYLCRAADGGCEYTGSDMTESHTGLGITDKSFNAVVEGLQQAMDKNHIPVRTQNRLLAKLAPDHKDIIHR
ncbi:MAG: group 1 truncated hemoglobin [Dokdonella sp.]